MAKRKYLAGVVTNCDRLNIRSEPSTDKGNESIIKVVSALTNVLVMPIVGKEDWYKVKIGSIYGYCMSKFIAVEKGE